jgi:hypothetical protein
MSKPYQIFVGCPFSRDVRSVYDHLKREIEAETPLSIILADTVGVSSSDYLLEHITELIRDSAACVFDVTGANPNVSLEVGIAHTIPVDFILLLKTRKPRNSAKRPQEREREVRSIISDLQGKNRIEYKTYDTLKKQLEQRYLNGLPYMKRWRQFHSKYRAMAPHALRLFADLRSSGRSTGARLGAFLEGTGFRVNDVLGALTANKLITSRAGRDGGIFYASK